MAGPLEGRALHAVEGSTGFDRLARGSTLGSALDELRGRSVVLAVADQLLAALVLIELDGIARRLVLCPADLPSEHLAAVVATAEADALIRDARPLPALPAECRLFTADAAIAAASGEVRRQPERATEWVLLTSGTTGVPKLVLHTLASLIEPMRARPAGSGALWSTFYDIRRYGGLQVFLRAMLGGGSLVLTSSAEPVGEFLARAGAHGITHLLGTPTHWRRALMSPQADALSPTYVRLSGEIADQGILDHLRAAYPAAAVVHAFASTEAGVAFEVTDGQTGFPASLLGVDSGGVEMKVADGSLRIRSGRTAARYLGRQAEPLRDSEGFVDTGDIVERRGERCYFAGRRGGVINVGGQKIHPEEVEAIINTHPDVRLSLVRARKSPITGALVIADVVPRSAPEGPRRRAMEQAIMEHCRARLPRHKVPAAINFVVSLDVGPSGKLQRRDA